MTVKKVEIECPCGLHIKSDNFKVPEVAVTDINDIEYKLLMIPPLYCPNCLRVLAISWRE